MPVKKEILVGKIYANWCFHCKQLMPEWEKMKLKLHSKPFTFIEIESEEEAKMANFKHKYKDIRVNGYPTIFARINNRFEYYTGNRDANSLEQWVLSFNANRKKQNPSRHTQRRKRKLI